MATRNIVNQDEVLKAVQYVGKSHLLSTRFSATPSVPEGNDGYADPAKGKTQFLGWYEKVFAKHLLRKLNTTDLPPEWLVQCQKEKTFGFSMDFGDVTQANIVLKPGLIKSFPSNSWVTKAVETGNAFYADCFLLTQARRMAEFIDHTFAVKFDVTAADGTVTQTNYQFFDLIPFADIFPDDFTKVSVDQFLAKMSERIQQHLVKAAAFREERGATAAYLRGRVHETAASYLDRCVKNAEGWDYVVQQLVAGTDTKVVHNKDGFLALELLTVKALAHETMNQVNCVYAYHSADLGTRTRIFSITHGGEKYTAECLSRTMELHQVRGRFNAPVSSAITDAIANILKTV